MNKSVSWLSKEQSLPADSDASLLCEDSGLQLRCKLGTAAAASNAVAAAVEFGGERIETDNL